VPRPPGSGAPLWPWYKNPSPNPATSLSGPGGRKTFQDARYTVDLGRSPEGRLASAQCPSGHPDSRATGPGAAVGGAMPGLINTRRGAISDSPLFVWRGVLPATAGSQPGSGVAPGSPTWVKVSCKVRRRLYLRSCRHPSATRPFHGGPTSPSLRLTGAAVPGGFSG